MVIRSLSGQTEDKRAYSTHSLHRWRHRGSKEHQRRDLGASWTHEGRTKGMHYDSRRMMVIRKLHEDIEQ